MGILWRGKQKFKWLEIVPGGTVQGMGTLPLGNFYYVDGNSGDNTKDGLSPDTPKETITAALALCVNNHDDYIIVLDGWNQDAGAVAVNKHRVHIIGVGNNLSPYVMQKATGDTHIFIVTGDYVEIAGFAMGGGATKAGINPYGALGLWVHDCFFGDADVGDTPREGILCEPGTVNAYMLIEDCIFAGSGGTSQGKISAYGIYAAGTNICRGSVFRNNIFGQIPTTALHFANMYGGFITGNLIACDADTAGAGIVMSGSTGCLIANNTANYGKTDMTANPFVDTGSVNCWTGNVKGDAFQHPA